MKLYFTHTHTLLLKKTCIYFRKIFVNTYDPFVTNYQVKISPSTGLPD